MLVDEGLELLDEEQCRRLLAGETLGRVGISLGALPAIFPVNYSMVDGDVMFRTGEGLKLRAALDHTIVAFEVDRASGQSQQGWSVLVVGVAEEVVDDVDRCDREVPAAGVGGERHRLIRVHPELISGRRIERPSA